MRRVAVATTVGEQVDHDWPLLREALAAEAIEAELCVWDDDRVSWADYELVVIRSTWDYTKDRAGFLIWASGVARLCNPFSVVEYSTDKHYLVDLAAKGHRIVPTSFCDVGATPSFPNTRFVVKPTVGAGSIDAEKYGADERHLARDHVARLHLNGRDAVIQPYIASVDSVGERAMVFIDGEFSHALTKGAMLHVADVDRNSLFRREQMSRAVAEPESRALAQRVLAEPLFANVLYARVDLVLVDEGWAVMELELVEPSLFLSFDDGAAGKLARAIRRRLK